MIRTCLGFLCVRHNQESKVSYVCNENE
jgi:hypothetical protein